MKSSFHKTQLLLFLFNILIFTSLKAQTYDHYSLGNDLSFFQGLIEKKSPKNTIHLKVDTKTSFPIDFHTIKHNVIFGKVKGKESYFKLIANENGNFEGHLIVSKDKNIAYKIASDKNHNLIVSPTNVDNILCELPMRKDIAENKAHKEVSNIDRKRMSKYANMDPFKMESRPESNNVILVDMDGYRLPRGTGWNGGQSFEVKGIDEWDDLNLKLLWAEVADKFSAFDVNVTSNEAVYDAARNTNRQRLVVTPSASFDGGRNFGVAKFNTYAQAIDSPCWVFMTYPRYTPDEAGDVGAHELGHTLTLRHQSTSSTQYYVGHDHPSHDGWVPLMGFSNRRMIAQWSDSEFRGATADQDDLAMIASKIPYINDDHSNTEQNASQLSIDNEGIIDGKLLPNTGLITKRTDIDFFKFESQQGSIEITIKPRPLNGNEVINRSILDIEAKLYNQFGEIIDTAETGHKDFLNGATFSFNLPSNQTYYISVDGYGTGDPITGYSDYSSIGPYSISGSIPKGNLSVDTNEKNDFKVYPIPAKEHLTIESKASQYLIISLLGQLVQEGKINSQKETVQLKGLQNGFYLLKLYNENSFSTKAVIIDK